jgi:MSHA biogenesis protein MshJ
VKQLWQRYAERIDARSVRERVFIFSAAMVLLLAFLYSAFIDPEMRAQRRLSSTLAQRQGELKSVEVQLTAIATGRAADPDRPMRERLAEVRAQLADTERLIGAEERKFTAPRQMRAVVEEMLARNRAVELVAMRTLATTTIAEARAESANADAAKSAPKSPAKPSAGDRLIYRHGIEVTVAGRYLDLLRYLGELENLPTQLYWSSLELDAARYPKHTMKLVLYTLSLDPAWLNV